MSQQFAFDAERGKPTIQFGRLLRILKELGIALNVEAPDEVTSTLEALKVRAQEKAHKPTKSDPRDGEEAARGK